MKDETFLNEEVCLWMVVRLVVRMVVRVLVKMMVRENGSEIYDEDGVDGVDEGFYEVLTDFC